MPRNNLALVKIFEIQLKCQLATGPSHIVMLTMPPLTTQMYGGMRGIRGLVTETSLLDPEEVRGQLLPGNHTITAFVCRESVSVVTVSRSYRSSCRRGQEGRSHCRRESFFSCSPGRSLVRVR